jgi:hypothetical protein
MWKDDQGAAGELESERYRCTSLEIDNEPDLPQRGRKLAPWVALLQ